MEYNSKSDHFPMMGSEQTWDVIPYMLKFAFAIIVIIFLEKNRNVSSMFYTLGTN